MHESHVRGCGHARYRVVAPSLGSDRSRAGLGALARDDDTGRGFVEPSQPPRGEEVVKQLVAVAPHQRSDAVPDHGHAEHRGHGEAEAEPADRPPEPRGARATSASIEQPFMSHRAP